MANAGCSGGSGLFIAGRSRLNHRSVIESGVGCQPLWPQFVAEGRTVRGVCGVGHLGRVLSCTGREVLQGGCPVHAAVTEEEARQAKAAHPNALLLVHPECIPAVSAQADYIGSTGGIIDFAFKSDSKEFIIGTENSIAEHLQYRCPDKRFYLLSKSLICPDMKATTLIDVLNCCQGTGGEEITLSADTLSQARRCIDAMISLGG